MSDASADAATTVEPDAGEDASLGPTSCKADSDCRARSLLCDPLTNICVACVFDDDCPDGARCREGTCERYTPCETSLDCVDDPNGYGICWEAAAQCVECTQAEDCEASSDCIDYRCVPYVPCRSSLDCTPPEVCHPDRERCVRCVADNDCKAGSVCGNSTCRPPCSSDNDCTPLGFVCYIDGGFCARCVAHADCPEAAHCEYGECRLDVCRADKWVCQGNAMAQCNSTGDGYTTPAQCVDSARCVETTTSASCELVPDAGGTGGTGGAGGMAGAGGAQITGGDGGGGLSGGGGATGGTGGSAGDGGSGGMGTGRSLAFLGDQQCAAAPDTTALSLTGDMTLEAFVKPLSDPPSALDYPIVGKHARVSGQMGYVLTYYRTPAGQLQLGFGVSVDGSALSYLLVPYTLTPGAWHHVAVTFVASTGTAEFFVNATSVGTVSGGPVSVFDTPVGVTVGCFNDVADTLAYWDGWIDEVRIWQGVRTSTEIDATRLVEVVGNEPGLVGAWHFNGNYADATSGGATLTPSNNPTFSTDLPF